MMSNYSIHKGEMKGCSRKRKQHLQMSARVNIKMYIENENHYVWLHLIYIYFDVWGVEDCGHFFFFKISLVAILKVTWKKERQGAEKTVRRLLHQSI